MHLYGINYIDVSFSQTEAGKCPLCSMWNWDSEDGRLAGGLILLARLVSHHQGPVLVQSGAIQPGDLATSGLVGPCFFSCLHNNS